MDASVRTMQAMEKLEPSVHSSPHQTFTKEEIAVDPNAAVIMAGGAFLDEGRCRPTMGRRGTRAFYVVDAGLTTIIGVCTARRMSSFEFVAEAGHFYTITATDTECMSLLDITAEEIVIACEPYEKRELVWPWSGPDKTDT